MLEAARLARADPRCRLFSLLTSTGSNSKSILSYARTKGLTEEGVKALGFTRTAIWRPGLLDRGDLVRGVEKFGLALAGGVPVRAVAGAMVEALECEAAPAVAAPACEAFSDAEIRRLVREASLAPSSPPSCAIV